jgi:transporter family-2 protein
MRPTLGRSLIPKKWRAFDKARRKSLAMLMKLILAALAVAAGMAVAFQGVTNQALLKSVGIGPALVVNTVVVLFGATGLWLATGAQTTFFPPSASWTLYVGGIFGFIVIASAVLVFPRLGAAYAVALMVCGQFLAALMIDHYGLMGMERSPATLPRVLGVMLVVSGVAVYRFAGSAAPAP